MRTSSSNALATRSIDEVWTGVRRSSRIQILLELPVEVLVRSDVEDFDDVPLRVELVGKQKLERLDLELDDPHTLERSDLGLANERGGDDALDDLVHLELGRRREPPLRLPEAGCLNDGALRRTAQSRPTGRAGRGRHGARPLPRGSPGSCWAGDRGCP